MPWTPTSARADFTSSNLKGLMTAVTSFMVSLLSVVPAATADELIQTMRIGLLCQPNSQRTPISGISLQSSASCIDTLTPCSTTRLSTTPMRADSPDVWSSASTEPHRFLPSSLHAQLSVMVAVAARTRQPAPDRARPADQLELAPGTASPIANSKPRGPSPLAAGLAPSSPTNHPAANRCASARASPHRRPFVFDLHQLGVDATP